MSTRPERNVGITSVAAGVGAMTFAIVSGLTTEAGGTDWIGVITVTAGLILVLTGLFNVFHHRTA